MNDATPTAVDLSLSPIDREWLRDRLIEFGLKRDDVHRSIDFCVAYLDTCGLGTRREVEDFLGDEVVLAELRDVYTTVLRRSPSLEPIEVAAVEKLSIRASMTAVRATVRVLDPLLDPVGLCQWGGLLRVRKQIGGDIGLREASRGLRQLLVQYPEAIAGLARVHRVQPNGAAIEPPQPEPAERQLFEFKPAKKKRPSKAKPRSKAKARRR